MSVAFDVSVTTSLLQSGVSVLKLKKSKLPQSRYLWLDSATSELRWSSSARTVATACKRLPLSEVKKVSKLSRYKQMRAEHGFTLDTTKKNYVFRTETLEMRDKLVAALLSVLKAPLFDSIPTTEDTENCATPEHKCETSAVLTDFNRHEGLVCSRALFSKTGSAHRKTKILESSYQALLKRISAAVAEKREIDVGGSPGYEDLPETVSQILECQHGEILKLTEDLQRELAESAKLTAVRKRLKTLESMQERCKAMEQENEDLRVKVETQADVNCRLEQQLAVLCPQTSVCVEASEQTVLEAHFDLLRKGFSVVVRCLADEVAANQLSLSPSKSVGEFRQRYMFCSQDLSQLIWKPVSPLAYKRVFIYAAEVTETISGSDEDAVLEEFPGYRCLTLLSPQITLTLLVEPECAFYLEAVRALVLHASQLPCTLPAKDDALVARYKVLCDQYESQTRQMEHQVKRYKETLTKGVFDLQNGLKAQQAVYNSEVEQLKEMSDRCILSVLSPESAAYLKTERLSLLQRLQEVNEAIAARLKA